jgi:hypothetical protein
MNKDVEAFDMGNVRYNHVNVTAFRFVEWQTELSQSIIKTIAMHQQYVVPRRGGFDSTRVIFVGPAMHYDAVVALAMGIRALERSATLAPFNASCQHPLPWPQGPTLFNFINSVNASMYRPLSK